MDEWNKGQSIKMSKNEGYWDAENIKLTNVIDPIYPAANEVLLYESGSGDQRLDWAVLRCRQLRALHGGSELSKQVSPYVYPGIWMMLPQVTVAPFDKLEVRTALGHAIDRDRLATVTQRSGHAGVLHGSARRVRFP